MDSINYSNNSVAFQARFQKLPGKIKVKQMLNEFTVPNPWAKGEVLNGKAGDGLATNLLNGESYPISPKVLAEKYEHLSGDIYQTRTSGPVYIEADLPKAAEIVSREGVEKTSLNGMPSMTAIDGAGQPYSIPADYFVKAYAPTDEASKNIFAQLQDKLSAFLNK